MTVKELITELAKYQPNTEVIIRINNGIVFLHEDFIKYDSIEERIEFDVDFSPSRYGDNMVTS